MLAYLNFTGHLELRIFLTALAVILCALPVSRRWLRPVENAFRVIGRRRWVAISVVFVISFAATASLALWRGIPIAYVHDEMSNLLAADTFAHGRLTNPTPPGWGHFESMHILVRPSYQSKYPPGQGLFMALGQVVFGKPIWGVWISTALAAAAACWMLYAFVSAPWALLGGILMALHPQILEWGQRYWGGNVAVLGGCLVVGGFGRIWGKLPVVGCASSHGTPGRRALNRTLQSVPRSATVLMSAGMIILGLSRPFEGLVLVVLLAPGMLLAMRRMGWAAGARKIVAPAMVVLVPGALWMGYYNYRVTGNALRLPYVESQRQYGVVPLFILSPKGPEPVYHSDAMKLFHVREQGYAYRYGHWPTIRREMGKSLASIVMGMVGNAEVLVLPLLALPWMFARDRRMRYLVIVLVLLGAAMLLETWAFPHYAAPAAGLCAVLVVAGMRLMWRSGPRVGRLLVRCTVALFVVSAAIWWGSFFRWSQEGLWANNRDKVAAQLAADTRAKHIVFVHYDLYRPLVPWSDVAAAVINDLFWKPVGRFSPEGLKGLPQNPPPVAGESRTIWLDEQEMSQEVYQFLYTTWRDRDWWRLELHAKGEPMENFYRWLADRYIRQQPGNHLVLFRVEGPKDDEGKPVLHTQLRHLVTRHNVHEEWVYNAADMNSARVIWARDLGEAENRKLLGYFRDRKAWIIDPEVDADRPRPYDPGR